jgi:EAL domain-containing protein (putative c-di-GMP-specific phosphodiesterase class I)
MDSADQDSRQNETAITGVGFLCPENRKSIRFAFRIGNYTHIKRAYGAEIAQATIEWLRSILAEIIPGDAIIKCEDDDTVGVILLSPEALGQQATPVLCDNWALVFCEEVALVRIPTSAGPVHLSLSGGWVRLEEAPAPCFRNAEFDGVLRPAFLGEPAGSGVEWGKQYRQDMTRVAAVLASIADDNEEALVYIDGRQMRCRFTLDWDSVWDARWPDHILYHEAVSLILDDRGDRHSASPLLNALERLGFCRNFDRFVVRSVVTELQESSTAVLGVNISAQSARCDGPWGDIIAILRNDRSIGSRLTIEISGTAAVQDISAMISFARMLHGLGVSIALDNFGASFASLRQTLALSPQIIKIDQTFLQRASVSPTDLAIFGHLVGLARASAIVVVGGVEDAQQSRTALDADVTWQQGNHWGRPTASRAWRKAEGLEISAASVVPFVGTADGSPNNILKRAGAGYGGGR